MATSNEHHEQMQVAITIMVALILFILLYWSYQAKMLDIKESVQRFMHSDEAR
jgi:membrane protein involved in colicin uptake